MKLNLHPVDVNEWLFPTVCFPKASTQSSALWKNISIYRHIRFIAVCIIYIPALWTQNQTQRILLVLYYRAELSRATPCLYVQYIPRNMHTVFALLCFVVVIHWLIFPYPSGLLHWHCGNITIAPVPAKQPWWIWINTSREFFMNDCIATTKQSTTKPCAYFLGYTIVR